jgi:L-fucose mutarotase
MLKGIDPLLGADVLYALRAMGHGDEIVLVDVNFPAEAVARATVLGRLLRMDGTSAPAAVAAILSVMPLDSFVDDPVLGMAVVDRPDEVLPVHADVARVVAAAEGRAVPVHRIERHDFYARARGAFAIVLTGERRFYGNVLLKKGVVPPPA